jgi:MFS family permease
LSFLDRSAILKSMTVFWRLWTASSLSNLADGVLQVALPLVAVRLTDSPTQIAGLTLALTLPWLLFALPAGALADRVDRRRAMLAANTARGLVLAALAGIMLAGAASIWLLYAVAFAIGTAETVYDTSAQSILPLVVPRARLSAANGRLYAAELTANQFVGPPLGGLLVAAGAAVAFGASAGLWVAALAALLLMPGRYRVTRERRTTLRADVAEGLRYLWRHHLVRRLALIVGVGNFASNLTFAVLVLYAVGPRSAMRLTDGQYGLLLAALAVGSMAGALVAEALERRFGRARCLVLSLGVCALSTGGPALTANPWLLGAVYVVSGAGRAVWNVIAVSLRQRLTPDHLLGRLNSAFRLIAWGTIPAGAATGGVLATYLGLRPVFAIAGVLALSLVLAARRLTDATMDAAVTTAEAAAPAGDGAVVTGSALPVPDVPAATGPPSL